MKVSEAAKYLGVAPITLRLWERQGKVRSTRDESGHRLFDQAELDRVKRQRASSSKFMVAYYAPYGASDTEIHRLRQEVLYAEGDEARKIFVEKGDDQATRELVVNVVGKCVSRIIVPSVDALCNSNDYRLVCDVADLFEVPITSVGEG